MQAFVNFHHLLLACVEKYPELGDLAHVMVQQFADEERGRNKDCTPDLGEFMTGHQHFAGWTCQLGLAVFAFLTRALCSQCALVDSRSPSFGCGVTSQRRTLLLLVIDWLTPLRLPRLVCVW